MRTLYNLGIRAYNFLIHLVAPFNSKAAKWVKGRKDIFQRIANEVEPGYIIWIHAASAGEFEQARTLIDRIRKEYPNKKIMLTFFSPSGYELRKNYQGVNYVYYLPVDTSKNARRFIDLIKPEMVFFIKYEYWYNYINELYKRVIPIYIVSAVFRPSQAFFKWYGAWFRKHLRMIEHFFVQDIGSAKLLGSLKIKRFSISGDTRFDRVWELSRGAREFENIRKFTEDSKVLLAGSTWPADENILKDFLQSEKRNFKLIIAPHEVDKQHISKLIKEFNNFTPIRYSEYENKEIPAGSRVLIIDSVGKLMHLYQYADVAYIGGGFGVGIHNILEAATFRIPVIFGPNYHKFNEAKDLVEKKGGFSISSSVDFQKAASLLLFDTQAREKASDICGDYVAENIGATDKIFEGAFNELRL